jgi:hypothetical protein
MMKLMQRNGGILLCGWLPPVFPIALAFICVLELLAYNGGGVRPPEDEAQVLPDGLV